MARMRTIRETIEHIKGHDPQTALTAYALRRMVLAGEIPTVKAGCKYLINIDALEELLSCSSPIFAAKKDSYPIGIRRLPERLAR